MLIVVRHGRTAANASGLLLGRADPPLDDVGRTQAAALATVIGRVDRVVSSPLQRCRETAAVLTAAGTGSAGVEVEVDDRFVELDYGELDGSPLASVPPEIWARWRRDIDFAPPGGESLAQLGTRVRAGLDDLLDAARHADIVVATHVSPIKAALGWALGVGDEVSWRAFVAPASITRITVSERGPTLAGFNDTSHLR